MRAVVELGCLASCYTAAATGQDPTHTAVADMVLHEKCVDYEASELDASLAAGNVALIIGLADVTTTDVYTSTIPLGEVVDTALSCLLGKDRSLNVAERDTLLQVPPDWTSFLQQRADYGI